MPVVPHPDKPSKAAFIVGWVLSGLPGLILVGDAILKLTKPAAVVEAATRLGYSPDVLVPLGIVQLTCAVLYLLSRTAVFGAVLLTGYLGGAVATHVHAGHGAPDVFLPVAFGISLWLGLYLREPRLRALVPLRL